MPTLELSKDESEVLVELLQTEISDLGTEIGHTDSLDYRNGLRAKKATAETILDRLEQVAS